MGKDTMVPFFEPKTVAVIASFRETWSSGYRVIKHMRTFGFSGKIYPVNPSYDKVLDTEVYPGIKEVPETVDLAIIQTPTPVVPQIIEECAQNRVKAAIIISDGFAERDEKGAELQQKVVDIARRSSMRILGPNTVGVTNVATGLVTTPFITSYEKIKRGGVAFCAQSGIGGIQAFPLEDTQYGFSKICDFGNKCDINEADLLEYLADDPETRVIAMHIEDVKDGQRFLKTAKEVTRKKPVLILKPGKTKEAKKALKSHTGALAGEDQVYDAAFKQAGIIRVETLEELLDLAKIFALQPLPRGNRVAIITTTGGVGILAIDTALECGLTMAELCEDSTKKLNEIFPMLGKNPIDIIPALLAFEDISLFYREAVTIALSDEGVDCASVVLYEAPITVLQQRSRIVEVFSELKKFGKPITVWLYGTSLPLIRELAVCLEDSGIPVYFDFVTAVKALGVAAKYSNLIFLKSR